MLLDKTIQISTYPFFILELLVIKFTLITITLILLVLFFVLILVFYVRAHFARNGSLNSYFYIKALKSNDENKRISAAIILGRKKAKEATLPLCNVLNDSHELVRKNALGALIKINDPGCAKYLQKFVTETPYEYEKLLAARILCYFAYIEYFPIIHHGMRSNDAFVRGLAASSIGYFKDQKGEELLINGLKDPEISVRFKCALALREIGSTKSLQEFDYYWRSLKLEDQILFQKYYVNKRDD